MATNEAGRHSYLVWRQVISAIGAALVGSTFVVAYLQVTGRLPSPLLTVSPWLRAAFYSMLIIVCVGVVWYALQVGSPMQREVVEAPADEEESRQANRELERRLAEQASDLSSFTSRVSHDLRGPVRHAQGYARMLIEDKSEQLDEEAREYIDRIIHSAHRMNSLIDDLMTLSRIGVRELQLSEVDMTDVAKSAAETISQQEKTNVKIQIGDLGRQRGDTGLLRLAWENLIDNAVKFTQKEAQPQITIGSEVRDGRVWYWIEDNGVGFDPAYVGKIFEPFERLHAEDEFKGSGLGLSNVRRIVEKHGGEVRALGKVGEGARFEFTLTREQPAVP